MVGWGAGERRRASFTPPRHSQPQILRALRDARRHGSPHLPTPPATVTQFIAQRSSRSASTSSGRSFESLRSPLLPTRSHGWRRVGGRGLPEHPPLEPARPCRIKISPVPVPSESVACVGVAAWTVARRAVVYACCSSSSHPMALARHVRDGVQTVDPHQRGKLWTA